MNLPINVSPAPRRIAILAFPGISSFHLSVPWLVFGEKRQDVGVPPCDTVVCALEPGPVTTSMGLDLHVPLGLEAMAGADVIIVPSWSLDQAVPLPLVQILRDAHLRGAILVGLCLGAFVLAETGLLDGRQATTHWHWAECFARRYPHIQLDSSVLYIDLGDVITSAGTAAGLDCCLHLLRRWQGRENANRLARRLVVPPHRQGNQAQYLEQALPPATGSRLASTLDWATARLNQDLDIAALADHAAMSRRSFTRHFRQLTGCTVVQWLTRQRLILAQTLLETSDLPVEQVAEQAGFGSSLSLRQAFLLQLDTTPARYRREFRGRQGEGG